MDVSDASYYIFNEKGNKGSQMGHTKKILKKKKKKKKNLRVWVNEQLLEYNCNSSNNVMENKCKLKVNIKVTIEDKFIRLIFNMRETCLT